MTATIPADTAAVRTAGKARESTGGPQGRRLGSYVFLTIAAIVWIAPVLWAVYLSFRPIDETNRLGYLSLPHGLTFDNYKDAWSQGDIPHFFFNSVLITVPAVIITLFLATCVAFVVARLGLRFNIFMLLMFTAGNLLPQQVFLAPLFKIYINIALPSSLSSSGRLYDSTIGIVAINIAFQLGFCVFVLSNFMRAIPKDIVEAGMVDGASVWRQYWNLTLPLCRPALAAMATLLTTWIYNDFFWALALLSTGSKYPITTALNDLKGTYAQNDNLLAAGSLIVAVPTLVVYFVLQRQFIAGLTLGASKE